MDPLIVVRIHVPELAPPCERFNRYLLTIMVTIAQLAEHLVVAQEAMGSRPIGHPTCLFWRPDIISPGVVVGVAEG